MITANVKDSVKVASLSLNEDVAINSDGAIVQEIDLLAAVEDGVSQMALIQASNAGALGIPAHGNTPNQVANMKTQYKSDRQDLVTAIGI